MGSVVGLLYVAYMGRCLKISIRGKMSQETGVTGEATKHRSESTLFSVC